MRILALCTCGVLLAGLIVLSGPAPVQDDVKKVYSSKCAVCHGEDGKGQPFSLRAGSAVQKSSREPIVDLNDMSARILLSEGPAVLNARKGRYDMDSERVAVDGPVQFEAAGGYRLTTRDVGIDLKTRRSNRLRFTPDGARVLVTDLDAGQLVVVDAKARKEITRVALGRMVEGILIAPDGSKAYVAENGDDTVAVVDLKTLTVLTRIKPGGGPDGMAWGR